MRFKSKETNSKKIWHNSNHRMDKGFAFKNNTGTDTDRHA